MLVTVEHEVIVLLSLHGPPASMSRQGPGGTRRPSCQYLPPQATSGDFRRRQNDPVDPTPNQERNVPARWRWGRARRRAWFNLMIRLNGLRLVSGHLAHRLRLVGAHFVRRPRRLIRSLVAVCTANSCCATGSNNHQQCQQPNPCSHSLDRCQLIHLIGLL